MKVLLTGSTGYIGRRLLPLLVAKGHEVICVVRDKRRFDFDDFDEIFLESVRVIEGDFADKNSVANLPENIDAAYFLIHSLNSSKSDFKSQEVEIAKNFSAYIGRTSCRQTIYLGGIANDKDLSQHLDSRKAMETILGNNHAALTVLRAGIVIGSGSASFEIIRDLVEKLPVMIAPKWINTRCQPISVANVLDYLYGVLGKEKSYNRVFDIGGEDVLTYKEMMYGFARIRGLKRWLIAVPVLTPRLSSLWLHFVTSTSYYLARNLIDSMRNEVIAEPSDIDEIVGLTQKINYEDSLRNAFTKINQKQVVSSWKDTIASREFNKLFIVQAEAPKHGVLIDKQVMSIKEDVDQVLNNIWEIGGKRGWYYGTFLWRVRGFMDKLVGGVGLRRGRRSDADIKNGDSLDFWRVLHADKGERRLLLFAEMKLPGEAWLEFKIKNDENGESRLIQTATFRPLGLWGRLYWYLVSPFHVFIFKNMARNIIKYRKSSVEIKAD